MALTYDDEKEVAGGVDAPPADDPQRKTEEGTRRRPQLKPTMTSAQYVKMLRRIHLAPYSGAAEALGISVRMSARYAAGSHQIPATIAKLLRALVALHNMSRAQTERN